MRHYYMKDVYIFIPEPGNTKAIQAVSAIARAMKETNKVAILRCVWRQGQGNVVVGVLTPNLSNQDNIPDSFYFNVLPFAEDVREFQFPSFSSFPSSWQPNEQQQEAADNLVKMLDLAPPGKEEALHPDFTPNPVLERFYRFLELKSKLPDAMVPPLDDTLKRITEPDPELLSQNKSVIDEFCKQFELKENPKIKKSSRRLWREKPSRSNEEENVGDITDGQSGSVIKNEPSIKVERIGDWTPVQDFEAIMSRRDSTEWVNKAISDMKGFIFKLVENSYEHDSCEKVLECLTSLRKGCILEQEPTQFNNFIRDLYMFCQKNNISGICELLASKQVKLITKAEAIDSDVTEDEARNFLIKTEPMLDCNRFDEKQLLDEWLMLYQTCTTRGVELKPGKPYINRYDDALGRLHVCRATLGLGKPTKTILVQCNVGKKSAIVLCSLIPDKTESCSLGLEFEEDDDVVFSDDFDSCRENIAAETKAKDSTDYGTGGFHDDHCVHSTDHEAFPPSPVPNSGVANKEILDDDKLPKENGNNKHSSEKGQQSNFDYSGSSQCQIVVGVGAGASVLEREDDDSVPTIIQNSEAKLKEKKDKEIAKEGKNKRKHVSDQVSGLRRKFDTVQVGDPEG
ncbi:hypothetical protein NE237_002068 [Protea cynaroides]|uniref:Ku domain-containing protein n=1 Tax=Protea cynaroides TaxID=273540 RepID=A0A9Q0QYZ4_9MAGN|nr:hypothetical protein NE237_002068 [Protea cynaroides]